MPAGVYAWCATERTPQLIAPAQLGWGWYPDMLLSANVEGEVVIEATVDESGRIDTASLSLRRTTHDLFTRNVRATLPALRVQPALIGRRAVRARGVIRVDFKLPRIDSVPVEPVLVAAHADQNGMNLETRWRAVKYAPPARVDTLRLFALIAEIARSTGGGDSSRAECLQWPVTGWSDAPAALFDYLRAHGVPRLAASKCPPTYQNQVQQLDSAGRPVVRPPGARDPHEVWINGLRAWTDDIYIFRYSEGVGTVGTGGRCQANWNALESKWRLVCGSRWRWVA